MSDWNVNPNSKVHATPGQSLGRQVASIVSFGTVRAHSGADNLVAPVAPLGPPKGSHRRSMEYKDKIVDKQVGRNSDLLAQSIAALPTKEERYPYLRILVSVIEQAHPEWNQAPSKDRQVGNLVFRMSRGELAVEEVSEIVRLRDAERGYGPAPDRPQRPKPEEAVDDAEASAEPKADTPSKEKGKEAFEASSTQVPSKDAVKEAAAEVEAPAADVKAASAKVAPAAKAKPSSAKAKTKAAPKPRASRAKKPSGAKETPSPQADIFAEAASSGTPPPEGGVEGSDASAKPEA
jgi:hypothetical protein